MALNYTLLTYDRIKARTALAILFDFGDEEKWIPISVLDPDTMPLEEKGGEVGVESWFTGKEGLEDYES